MNKINYTLGITFIVVLAVSIIAFMLTRTSQISLDETVFEAMAEDLILINYQNEYEPVIKGLPEIVTDGAKAVLLENTSTNYNRRAMHGSITDIEFVLYSQDLAESKKQIIVISKYKELQLYNAPMTSIAIFTIQEGRVVEIETHDYTDSVSIHLN